MGDEYRPALAYRHPRRTVRRAGLGCAIKKREGIISEKHLLAQTYIPGDMSETYRKPRLWDVQGCMGLYPADAVCEGLLSSPPLPSRDPPFGSGGLAHWFFLSRSIASFSLRLSSASRDVAIASSCCCNRTLLISSLIWSSDFSRGRWLIFTEYPTCCGCVLLLWLRTRLTCKDRMIPTASQKAFSCNVRIQSFAYANATLRARISNIRDRLNPTIR
jgi:hypothetical protein